MQGNIQYPSLFNCKFIVFLAKHFARSDIILQVCQQIFVIVAHQLKLDGPVLGGSEILDSEKRK